jgi:hypothetical protein
VKQRIWGALLGLSAVATSAIAMAPQGRGASGTQRPVANSIACHCEGVVRPSSPAR